MRLMSKEPCDTYSCVPDTIIVPPTNTVHHLVESNLNQSMTGGGFLENS